MCNIAMISPRSGETPHAMANASGSAIAPTITPKVFEEGLTGVTGNEHEIKIIFHTSSRGCAASRTKETGMSGQDSDARTRLPQLIPLSYGYAERDPLSPASAARVELILALAGAGRAQDRSIGTIDTAVTRFGPQQGLATLAPVEKLVRVHSRPLG